MLLPIAAASPEVTVDYCKTSSRQTLVLIFQGKRTERVRASVYIQYSRILLPLRSVLRRYDPALHFAPSIQSIKNHCLRAADGPVFYKVIC